MKNGSRADQRNSALLPGPIRGEDDGGKAWAGQNDKSDQPSRSLISPQGR